MSHFYGSLRNSGQKTESTKGGHKTQLLSSHLRTWDFGVSTNIYQNDSGYDEVEVSLTGGSDGGPATLLGRYSLKDYEKMVSK